MRKLVESSVSGAILAYLAGRPFASQFVGGMHMGVPLKVDTNPVPQPYLTLTWPRSSPKWSMEGVQVEYGEYVLSVWGNSGQVVETLLRKVLNSLTDGPIAVTDADLIQLFPEEWNMARADQHAGDDGTYWYQGTAQFRAEITGSRSL